MNRPAASGDLHVIESLRRYLLDRLGRRGTLALGVGVVLLFAIAGGPLFVAGLGSSVVAVVLFAVLLVAPSAWVLWDARARGVARPFVWALFALFGHVVGALVYLLVRDAQPQEAPCSTCQRDVRVGLANCPWCGAARATGRKGCPKCGSELERGWRFCPYCRIEVEGT